MGLIPERFTWQNCLSCNASGRRGISLCNQCGGSGSVYAAGAHMLYWRRSFSIVEVLARQWERTIQLIISGALVVLLAAHALITLYQIYISNSLEGAGVYFWNSNSFISFIWWIFFIADFYLLYRLWNVSYRWQPWHRVVNNSKNTSLNITDYFSAETLRELDQAWLQARTNRKLLTADSLAAFLLHSKDVALLFARLGLDQAEAEKSFQSLAMKDHQVTESHGLSQGVYQALLLAALLAAERRHSRVQSLDLFVALTKISQHIPMWFNDKGVDETQISHVHSWVDFQQTLYRRYSAVRQASLYRPKGTINRSYTASATLYLDRFSQDLTLAARQGALSLIVGRDKEFNELYRSLESGVSALVLIGESGVGKRSLIDQLANLMVADDVPKLLQDKRLVRLDLPSLIAGAMETGEIQQRMVHLTREVIRSGNIILYIENIHGLVGASGRGADQLDLSEVMAQQIRDPRLIVIGSTTPQDYHRLLEGTSLAQEMHQIILNEPERELAIEMLLSHVPLLEAQFPVFISFQAVAQAVDLSSRYMHDRRLPDKAVKLLSEVAAAMKANKQTRALISAADVARIVSETLHVPVTQVDHKESDNLLHLADRLHQRVIGQDEAVSVVVSALQRARVELRDARRPIVNLLFLGPTGVGKTELAKAVAESYFGNEQTMIRLDMSEYQSADSLARLIGGVQGKSEGLLTEAVRRQPYSLLLLDELEKAHPDILNVFLQVMDDGRLTDATGRTVDFTNIILIATSNAGSQFIQDSVRAGQSVEQIKKDLLDKELAHYYRPELLNRFDAVVVFKPLTEVEITSIAALMLGEVATRLKQRGIQLTVTPEALAELAHKGFDPVYGARPLRRVMQEQVDTALAQYLLRGTIGRRDSVILKPGGVIEVTKAQPLP